MTELSALWLPILLSSIIVFLVSSVIHMASPWHKGDYPRLQNEDELRAALRPLAIPPGDYMVPRAASNEDMRSAEFKAKYARGPVMVVTVWPSGSQSIGRSLILWFAYCLVAGGFTAYIVGNALPAGATYMQVFKGATAAGFACYALGLWQMSIWYRRAWSATIKASVDGLIYASLTAGMLGWLWPR